MMIRHDNVCCFFVEGFSGMSVSCFCKMLNIIHLFSSLSFFFPLFTFFLYFHFNVSLACVCVPVYCSVCSFKLACYVFETSRQVLNITHPFSVVQLLDMFSGCLYECLSSTSLHSMYVVFFRFVYR